eukprot:CAMPEP_0194308140 /NCGR_PEP_ID=MMETSP0171-20130528/5046_1 /TAXON_ID=218684 /ORGANISM="Corethron pennatum, Strain L29A3" /LENGTH=384 /DNA_ID=CAMNT_0039060577 /DNA_START=43 /DNA_END=1197 /DNA_ORIENTATION=+
MTRTRSLSFSVRHGVTPKKNQFTFGVIADVQWADAPDGYNYSRTVKRCYRGALATLASAVDWWQNLPEAPLYIAQLGDLIDGVNSQIGQTDSALAGALDHLARAPCPSVNIVGNHELYNFNREDLSKASWLRHGDAEFYSFFPAQGWRTIVLDPYQIGLIGHAADDPRRMEAVEILARENPNVSPDGEAGDWLAGMADAGHRRRFVPYNGGFGGEQLNWLRSELAAAAEAAERVLIMSHVIIHPEACGGSTMAWDYEEALDIISSEEAAGCVAAVLCGHDHSGGYHHDDEGVHHCTFVSPLNKGEEGFAFGLMHVEPDYIEIRGPKIDDLLPYKNGRPISNTCKGDSISGICEFIRLPIKANMPRTIKNLERVDAIVATEVLLN